MNVVIFITMAIIILYLMNDNRRLERMVKIATKAAIKEQLKRKTLEIMVYGRELDNSEVFDDEALYQDL